MPKRNNYSSLDILIYNLRLKKMTYEEIRDSLNEKGIEISLTQITAICERINLAKRQNPQGRIKVPSTRIAEISDAELLELRLGGYSYREIKDVLKQRGIIISHEAIRKRITSFCEKIGISVPKTRKKPENIECNDEYTL